MYTQSVIFYAVLYVASSKFILYKGYLKHEHKSKALTKTVKHFFGGAS